MNEYLRASEVFIHPTIVAMSLKSRDQLVESYNKVAYPTEPFDAEPGEARILNGLLLYHVLAERDLIMPKSEKARFDKAKLSGRIFQDGFERLFRAWAGDSDRMFLADVDSMIKGLDYVVASSNPVEYRAGIQCKFSVSSSTPNANNHYSHLRRNISDARGVVGRTPLASVVFRTESGVPEPLAEAVGANHASIFLNHSGVTGLAFRMREIRALQRWLFTR